MTPWQKNKKLIFTLGVVYSLIIIVAAILVNTFGDQLTFEQDKSSSQSVSDMQSSTVSSTSTSQSTSSSSSQSSSQSGSQSSSQAAVTPPITDSSVITPTDDNSDFIPSFNKPQDMRAVVLAPQVDFLVNGKSEQLLTEEIDTAIQNAVSLSMNTVIIQTSNENGVVYPSAYYPQLALAFDPLEYAIKTARASGLYVYVEYDLLKVTADETIAQPTRVNNSLLDEVFAELSAFCSTYKVDGIMLDSYTIPDTDQSYAYYQTDGMGIGYDVYMEYLTKRVVELAKEIIYTETRGTQVGILAQPVWENASNNELGSNTSIATTMLTTGNADVRQWLEDGIADFVMVQAFGSQTDQSIPYSEVVGWWSDITAIHSVPYYIMHSADSIATQKVGWAEPDQITKQVIEAQELVWYDGSAFSTLSALVDNRDGATDTLVKYYNNEISSDYVLAELEMSQPQKQSYETYETVATFQGATLPGIEVTLNDVPVQTNSSGYFSVTAELEAGDNTFIVKSKDKVFTYNIYRIVKVIDEISPTGNITVDGGMNITVTVTAYDGASVTATLGSDSIELEKAEDLDNFEMPDDTSYVIYTGTFTAPDATTEQQALGNINFSATFDGIRETEKGAYVTVNKRAELGSGVPIVVVANQAETFPIDTLDDYSSPDHYPLPKGALDYTVGDEIVYNDGNDTYRYYRLESGLRVYSDDISDTDDELETLSDINGMAITNNGDTTTVELDMNSSVSYTVNYTSNYISFDFHYTDKVPAGIDNLTKNPLFSSATWDGTELTLEFRERDGILGYTADYRGSNLSLEFINPPSSLANAKIVIDPGHGGTDPGALGFISGKHESYITEQIGLKLTSVLRNVGAEVLYIDISGDELIRLDERIEMAENFQPHIYISVHCNSALNSSATGRETYYFYPFSESLADAVNDGMISGAPVDRGVKFNRYYVTRTSHYASVLAETGFISNNNEYTRLLNSTVQQNIANDIMSELKGYFSSLYAGSYPTGTQVSGEVSNVPVTSINIVGGDIELSIGEEKYLDADIVPSNATSNGIVWSSDNSAVVTVSTNGYLKAIKAGVATITATTSDGKVKDTIEVRVKTAQVIAVASVDIVDGDIALGVGEKISLTTDIKPSNATNKTLVWSSENERIATVSSSGVVTGVALGDVVINVESADGKVGDFIIVNVEVPKVVPVESVDILGGDITLNIGEEKSLVAEITPENATNKTIEWTSSNEKVATVSSSGKITAVAVGDATIIAASTDSKVDGIITVTVTENKPIPITDIDIVGGDITLNIGEEKSLVAEITPENATNKTLEWTSSNEKVATVSSSGKITAVAVGETTITAASTDSKVDGIITVTVTENKPIPITDIDIVSGEITLNIGEKKSLVVEITPENATNKTLEWTSDDEQIATVSSSGEITAVGVGETTITAASTDSKVDGVITVTVTALPTTPTNATEETRTE